MYSCLHSACIQGVTASIVQVEADISAGFPSFEMVGALASEVKETRARVRTALRNCGISLPARRISVNISPASLHKQGTAFDLAVAVSLLQILNELPREPFEHTLLLGELGLNGAVREVRGVLSMVLAARAAGFSRVLLPAGNLAEARLVPDIQCEGISHLQELTSPERSASDPEAGTLPTVPASVFPSQNQSSAADFADVRGQLFARRAAEIAAAGFHHLLMIGPPGSGKTMIASRIPGILPELTRDESLEITEIASICGTLPKDRPLLTSRPFRAPHHTISPSSMVGGGRFPKPGEITLAHRGVLFLDETPLFSSRTLNSLRQPLEEHSAAISRLGEAYLFPAHFMLIGAMNPCPCGLYPAPACTCQEGDIQSYMHRIPAPLLDRIDLFAETSPLSFSEYNDDQPSESTEQIRERILAARARQEERFAQTNIRFNSELTGRALREACALGSREEKLLESCFSRLQLSARGIDRLLRTARTIADLAGSERITCGHLSEAVSFRSPIQKYRR